MFKGTRATFLLGALSYPIFGLIGCGTIPRNPVPIAQIPEAEIPGMPGIRSFIGKRSPSFYQDFVQSIHDEPPDLYPPNPDGLRSYSALVLVGGGPQGAFGAGFLYGWTRAGTRPEFNLEHDRGHQHRDRRGCEYYFTKELGCIGLPTACNSAHVPDHETLGIHVGGADIQPPATGVLGGNRFDQFVIEVAGNQRRSRYQETYGGY